MHIYVRVLKELKERNTEKNHTFTLPSAGQTQNTRNTQKNENLYKNLPGGI